ncbi:GAF domain-containing protein [Methylobacterium sp. E-065]|uniref:histidine kinase dimerization/phosphoacceptor domain -containing protein n=1 Tax=Methylobacterium sp. E-065 TaxID=2836583 RepID=UPI001FB8C296|nr:histidine kinase dimerization/phosphoacceptor domain -containing protein [Methylobacterium sp. E-065]MCJ2018949.1 GAF domain-containing protein [Methylobacterium sp. E-065]
MSGDAQSRVGARPPAGIVRIDDVGIVIEADPAAADLLGHSTVTLAGRRLFDDLVPGADVPRGRGRFLAGVRRGHVDVRGRFGLDRDTGPVCLDLHVASDPGRNNYRVELVPVVSAPAHAAAEVVVERRERAEPVDVTACEREPIHVPGSVQPDAVLLVADPGDLRIVAHSANFGDAFPHRSATLVGGTLDGILPSGFVARVRQAHAANGLAEGRTVCGTLCLDPAEGAAFLAVAHARADRVLVELEAVPDRPGDFGPAHPYDAGVSVARLRAARTVAEVAEATANEVRAVTGFECVLVYRFDADWNGEAIAEDKVADWSRSLLGLHFPASDIPAQARALYLRSRSRFVTDRDAEPVALIGDAGLAGKPIDLTFAKHRSLSPIHLEYQRNLGVNGSMSASIIVDGALWGLLIGHHRRPHYVTPEGRTAAGLLAEALAMRVQEIEGRRLWEAQQAHLAAEGRLVRQLTRSDDYVAALTTGETTMLDLFEAGGAAVVSDGTVAIVGLAPEPDAVLALRDWLLANRPPEETGFSTHAMAAAYPPAEAFADRASGVVAVFVDEARRNLLLWFRPEVPSTVSWGGDPRKPVAAGSGSAPVLPRRSFERWVEERRGMSRPWAEWQVSFATSLAQVVEGIVLRQRRTIDELTGLLADKERALEQKDVLSREIDHRVKNSLQIVSAFLQMQQRQTKDPDAKQAFAETSARVMSVARVHDSLYQAENVEDVDLGQTIEVLCRDLSGMAGDGQTVGITADAKVMVPYRKAVALSLIATELVTNAFKYASTDAGKGHVEVSVRDEGDGRVRVRVCDDGEGLPEGWAERKPKGTGLGMKLVRAMLDQIDARLEVANTPGACFTVHA